MADREEIGVGPQYPDRTSPEAGRQAIWGTDGFRVPHNVIATAMALLVIGVLSECSQGFDDASQAPTVTSTGPEPASTVAFSRASADRAG